MTEEESKNCPVTCPYLQDWHNFCTLFMRKLETSQDLIWRCAECLNPEQRKQATKIAELRGDARSSALRQNTGFSGNTLKVDHKRAEEGLRQKFIEFLEDKFGSRPPLEGNTALKNLIVNLFMALDATERNMMNAVLNGKRGMSLIKAIDKAPKDESLLRNVRRELEDHFEKHKLDIKIARYQYENGQNVNH
ncbi:MAG: hypothetical protein J6N45_09370 [Alphaproteobacteria bacterium]|nr:hypothetical protein [Alphaproteobacteria bacterium]